MNKWMYNTNNTINIEAVKQANEACASMYDLYDLPYEEKQALSNMRILLSKILKDYEDGYSTHQIALR